MAKHKNSRNDDGRIIEHKKLSRKISVQRLTNKSVPSYLLVYINNMCLIVRRRLNRYLLPIDESYLYNYIE